MGLGRLVWKCVDVGEVDVDAAGGGGEKACGIGAKPEGSI